MAHLLGIYEQVVARGASNIMTALLQLPSNLVFDEWEQLLDTPEDNTIMDFLKYGFPVGYMGPVPTPSANHLFANRHRQDLATYITKELCWAHSTFHHFSQGAKSTLHLLGPRKTVSQEG